MTQKVEVSHKTIIFTVLFLLFLYFLYQVRQILVFLFLGFIFTAALNPLVEKLSRLKIPRSVAVVIIYLGIFLVLGLLLGGIIPPLVSQTSLLVLRLPDYWQSLGIWGANKGIINGQLDKLLSGLSSLPFDLAKITIGIFGNLISFFVFIFVSFYLLLARQNLDEYLLKFFGSTDNQRVALIIKKIEGRMGKWVRAQITLMLIVGVFSYIGLRLLGIDFALPLAILAGLLEIIPNFGPTIASIPAIFAGLAISPLMALTVAALYFLIQQVENTLIVPQVMAKETGLNPLVTILALIAGFKLGGILGAVFAIPLVLVAETFLLEFTNLKRFKS